MARTTTRVEGFRELDRALGQLPKATAKGVLRRIAVRALTPMRDDAITKAPDDPRTGGVDLKRSIVIGTKLNKRQSKMQRREGKSFVEMHMGTNNPAGVQQEFGNVNHGPQSFMRPAWDGNKKEALEIIKRDLGGEIEKAAARAAKRAARKALKGR